MSHNRQIILDTETTGFKPNMGDRILEFAGIEMKSRQLTGSHLHLYIHPDRDIPEDSINVHGITLEKLEGEPKFEEVGQRIADYLRGAELIIHNAPFDVGFLDMEFQRMGLPTIGELGCKVTDTLAMAREMFPGQKNSLDALCNRLEVDRSKRVFHGALIDCELLAEVYLSMTRGQFSLVDDMAAETEETFSVRRTARPASLKVLQASEEELAEHEAYLDALDKAVGGVCQWRKEKEAEGAA
ncbi:DNA polymerase III subunit epsilon [Neisseria sp. 83E34]|uniref:DNA polymerase III subunit epsilon n=1 Tax=Neisseria sp. 83E34 TaxID=1692264 RepID=UPI0006CE955F|nr:DNA polymerase III subunit epsilon [Neisseria sp. 83E34]KPN70645.1 DNA polymerase III subunit epsilon [Neisseria sp. 83E34]